MVVVAHVHKGGHEASGAVGNRLSLQREDAGGDKPREIAQVQLGGVLRSLSLGKDDPCGILWAREGKGGSVFGLPTITLFCTACHPYCAERKSYTTQIDSPKHNNQGRSHEMRLYDKRQRPPLSYLLFRERTWR